MKNLWQRFDAKYTPEPNSGCWLWTGGVNNQGYGMIWSTPRIQLAHRIGYEMMIGPIPDGLELDHKCRMPACVNPWHLEPVTHAENCQRGEAGEYQIGRRQTHCSRGHLYDDQTTYISREGWRQCRTCAHERYLRRRTAK